MSDSPVTLREAYDQGYEAVEAYCARNISIYARKLEELDLQRQEMEADFKRRIAGLEAILEHQTPLIEAALAFIEAQNNG